MAGLQTKVNQYEREVQQLKRALSRSDAYIEELTTKLNKDTAQKTSASRNKASRFSLPDMASTSTITTPEPETDGATSAKSPTRPSSAPGHVYSVTSSSTNVETPRVGDLLCKQDKKGGTLQRTAHNDGYSGDGGHFANGSPSFRMEGVPEQSSSCGDPYDVSKELVPRKTPPQKRLMQEDLNVFSASRKLMQLSENLNRKRGANLPENSRVQTDLVELSPCGSDSPGRAVARLPGSDSYTETPSSPQILPVSETGAEPQASTAAPRDEIISNTSSSEDSTPDVLNTFSLAKIKTEISTPCQAHECPLKKVKMERSEAAAPE